MEVSHANQQNSYAYMSRHRAAAFTFADSSQQARGQAATKLFNGWSISPAGHIIPLEHLEAVVPVGGPVLPANMTADLPLKMIVSPDGKVLLAACAGYNSTGLAAVDLAAGKLSQFLPEPEVFNGLAFSRDGKKVYLSGGDSGKIYVFEYHSGKLSPGKPVEPAPNVPSGVFLAGIAVHPATGDLYVANEANHEVWVLDAETLAWKDAIATGLHPYSCAFGGDGVHLYVSNWGSRSVSIIDTQSGRKVRDVAVGVRPNDMVLSRRPALRRLLRRQYGPRDSDAHLGAAVVGPQSAAAAVRVRPRNPGHFALSGLARRQHARRRGGRSRRKDALRGQRRQ